MSQSQQEVLKELEAEGYTVTRRGWPSFIAVKGDEVRLIKAISPSPRTVLYPEQIELFRALARAGIVVEVARGSMHDVAPFTDSLPPGDSNAQI